MKIGYDAITFGERDFLMGSKFLLNMKKKFNIPFVSANIYYPDSTTRFVEPYIIRSYPSGGFGLFKKQLRVGIFGVMMSRARLVYSETDVQLITKDPIESAKEVVAELSGKCDVIVALGHLMYNQIDQLARDVPGIDIIVGTHDYLRRVAPIQIKNTWVLQTGSKGQFIGDMRIELNNQKQLMNVDGVVESLDTKFKDDPSLQIFLDAFDRAYDDTAKKELEARHSN